jgi:hypothetical protein
MRKSPDYIILSALAGILAILTDVVSMFTFGILRLGYDSMSETVSALGSSNNQMSGQISAIWIMVGVLLILFGVGFRIEFLDKGTFAKGASWLIILYGLGEGIGSGIFKADRFGRELTTSGVIHEILGSLGVIAILILPLIMQKVITKKENPWFQIVSILVFVLGVLFMVFFLFRFSADKTNFFSQYKGLWQRLFILITYIYLFSIAVIMIRKHQKHKVI